MGDRNNPIKFGPEWLRNLAAERSAGTSGSQSNAAASAAGAGAAATATGNTASAANTNTAAQAQPKVQLAKLRYGREEMLALYDRTSEAPQELKFIDILYQPRGKPPVALNNTFEDEMRETMRAGPPIGGMSPGERFGLGRGMGRGLNITEARGRARIPFVRQTSAGRGAPWHTGAPRMPAFGGGTEEEASATLRSWSSPNNGTPRSGGDQPEWNPNKMFRNKRQGNTTNWRQTARDDDEWRQEVGRSRGTQQDKWERDWGDRPTTEKSPSWNSNRRTWVGGDSQNEENLPEWAIDTAEGCGGSFDSSGAFHGYSNDDSNLPKNQDTAFPLTRSHTHGSFVRPKNAEEGSEEWWASEKAKKLSPKRFDASDLKFKKISAVIPDIPGASAIPIPKSGSSKDGSEKDKPGTPTGPTEDSHDNDEAYCKKNVRFSESKRFDSLMRSDINMEEAKDDRSNFQSVMITPNNSLRQKHQNIVTATGSNNNRQNRKPGILQMLPNNPPASDSELGKQQSAEEKMAAEMMDLTLEENEYPNMPSNENPLANASPISSVSMMSKPPPMQLRLTSPVNHNPMTMNTAPGMQGMQSMQTVGISNSALNASLGLSLGPNNQMTQMGMPMQNIPPPVMPNPGMQNPNVGGSAMQGGMPGFPTGMPGMSGPNVVNNSLFMGQNSMGQNSNSMQSNDIPMPNHNNPNNMYPMHGLQHPGAQSGFGSSIYTNIMQQASNAPAPCAQALAEQWYYEDPKKSVQGPFSSKEMYNWYRAGFFSPTLMVRRACDALMRPLGSYGPVVPFVQLDMLAGYPMPTGFEPRQVSRESLLSSQQSLGMDVMNMALNETNSMDSMQYSNVNRMRNPPYGQSQQMVESLWSQPSTSQDMLWMQQAINNRNENRVNNLPMFFWEQQPSAIASNSLIPEEIAKEMKTEDQILAQLRASQNISSPQNLPYLSEQQPPPALKQEEGYLKTGAPTMDELQKLLQQEAPAPLPTLDTREHQQPEVKKEVPPAHAEASIPDVIAKSPPQSKPAPEPKQPAKPAKADDKAAKKDSAAKTKAKKSKEERKEEQQEVKPKEEEPAVEQKRSQEASPTKNKKEEKINKKELEKEKKEWVKEGFTIVKGAEKSASKESKKKTEEAKAAEEAERKRKEEEKLAAEGEKKKKQADAIKKQQEPPPRPAELVMKKAAWSGVSAHANLSPSREGLTLAEIQRLERETKLQQMKEQQQMMQMIAQQQAAALAREQEMQAGLGWAKKKGNAMNCGGQSLAEIQAEARKQASAAAAAAAQAQALEEAQAAPLAIHPAPWSNPPPAGGFWETMALSASSSRPLDSPKTVEKKKKPAPAPAPVPASVPAPASASASAPAPTPKKEITPAAQFETWCTTVLASWSAKIDVPTFVGFLKDIESPYEVKDYVKCYLGESKDTGDFARQFLEKRSKLLRVGMVTPSDDLCSPAMAVNPRTLSNSDYQEVKGKGKKTKKNKMLKVDARILGFSVTASEDRINVGDIDTV